MSIDKDPEVYKILLGVIMAFFGLFNGLGISILKNLKKNDENIYNRLNKTDNRVTAIESRCEERHKNG